MHLGRVSCQELCDVRDPDRIWSLLVQEHPGYQGRRAGSDTRLSLGEFPRLARCVWAAVTRSGIVAQAVHGDPHQE